MRFLMRTVLVVVLGDGVLVLIESFKNQPAASSGTNIYIHLERGALSRAAGLKVKLC